MLDALSGAGQRGVLEHGDVRIEDDAGRVLAERAEPALVLQGPPQPVVGRPRPALFRRLRPVGLPERAVRLSLARRTRSRRPSPGSENGETWRGLRVRFPDDVPAHSREQLYYFGDDGLLRRNDYTAEVFGGWAKAAHYCWEHRDFSGLVVPTHRKAMPRGRAGGRCGRLVSSTSAIADVRRSAARQRAPSGRP